MPKPVDANFGDTAKPQALVAFHGRTDFWWLRVLRPGFRHCLAVIPDAGQWVMINPLSIGTEVSIWPGLGVEDMKSWLTGQGYTVATCAYDPPRANRRTNRPLPWRPYTCVEAVKRALGLRMAGVLTPWQLFCALHRKKVLDKRSDLAYNHP
ncbi:MAG: hypothetical protein HQL36_01330 [Alphaproteobacteria bacterium]|nr:hypothetical protein [Alphaproteobacteria bacterium]MBF0249875.1 hypothetical protein [Alphaproteobacteria bacterium]